MQILQSWGGISSKSGNLKSVFLFFIIKFLSDRYENWYKVSLCKTVYYKNYFFECGWLDATEILLWLFWILTLILLWFYFDSTLIPTTVRNRAENHENRPWEKWGSSESKTSVFSLSNVIPILPIPGSRLLRDFCLDFIQSGHSCSRWLQSLLTPILVRFGAK